VEQSSYSAAKTVEKAFRLLEILSETQPARPSELVQQLGLTRSNVHRLLATLEHLGYVTKNSDTGYCLSLKMFILGNRDPWKSKLSEIAHPYMMRLAEISQENVNLALRYGQELLYIHKIESTHYLRLDQPVGRTDPFYCTALGKSLLSGLTEEEFQSYCKSVKFIPHTRRTITVPRLLWEAIQKVRKDGYALDLEELREGIHCIGAPIHDYSNRVVAAISISAPAMRLTRARIKNLRSPLIEISKGISRQIGYKDEGEKKTKGSERRPLRERSK